MSIMFNTKVAQAMAGYAKSKEEVIKTFEFVAEAIGGFVDEDVYNENTILVVWEDDEFEERSLKARKLLGLHCECPSLLPGHECTVSEMRRSMWDTKMTASSIVGNLVELGIIREEDEKNAIYGVMEML